MPLSLGCLVSDLLSLWALIMAAPQKLTCQLPGPTRPLREYLHPMLMAVLCLLVHRSLFRHCRSLVHSRGDI